MKTNKSVYRQVSDVMRNNPSVAEMMQSRILEKSIDSMTGREMLDNLNTLDELKFIEYYLEKESQKPTVFGKNVRVAKRNMAKKIKKQTYSQKIKYKLRHKI